MTAGDYDRRGHGYDDWTHPSHDPTGSEGRSSYRDDGSWSPQPWHGQSPEPWHEQWGDQPPASDWQSEQWRQHDPWQQPHPWTTPPPEAGDATPSEAYAYPPDADPWQQGPVRPDAPAPDAEEDDRGRGRKRRGLPLWQEIPLLLIIALCVAVLVRTFLLQAFYIPSGSMEDTLLVGDRVLVNKVVYHFREPARGEVVVFQGTDEWTPQPMAGGDIGFFGTVTRTLGDLIGVSSRPEEKEYIKRIIGLPGDRISCCDVEGRVFVNGHPLDEDYVTHDAPLMDRPEGAHDCRTRRFDEVVVEPGHVFFMGDHRAISLDSRCQGQVPIDNIIGRAFVIVWPSSRWAGLSAPATFDAVPQAAPATMVTDNRPVPVDPVLVVPALLLLLGTFRDERRVPGGRGGAGS